MAEETKKPDYEWVGYVFVGLWLVCSLWAWGTTGHLKIDFWNAKKDPEPITMTANRWPTTTISPYAPARTALCNPNYYGTCVPNVSFDIDCPLVGHRVSVVGRDEYGLDDDADGVGCELYPG